MSHSLLKHFLLGTILGLWAYSASAQTPIATTPVPSATAVAERLSDEDLSLDLAAEALPTTDKAQYWWENVRANIVRAFTRNAERKAELYEEHLHRLDRKAEACAAIGDDACLVKIDEHRAALAKRAERFISRREELRDRLLERFQHWREHRALRREDLKTKLEQNRANTVERREEFREERGPAEKRREQHQQDVQQNLKASQLDLGVNLPRQRFEFKSSGPQEIHKEIRQEIRDEKGVHREDILEKHSDNADIQVRQKTDATGSANVTSKLRLNVSTD